MQEIKFTNKYFGEALRELMAKNKLTYRDFVEKSGVSKTYLTQILVHNITPSKKIIMNIAKALGINPFYFKEFRIINVIDQLERYHNVIDSEDISQLESLIDKIKNKIPENVKPIKIQKEKSTKYTPAYMLDLSVLGEQQKKIINLIYKEYIKDNKKTEKYYRESLEFEKSDEYNDAVEWAGKFASSSSPEFFSYLTHYQNKYLKMKEQNNKKGKNR